MGSAVSAPKPAATTAAAACPGPAAAPRSPAPSGVAAGQAVARADPGQIMSRPKREAGTGDNCHGPAAPQPLRPGPAPPRPWASDASLDVLAVNKVSVLHSGGSRAASFDHSRLRATDSGLSGIGSAGRGPGVPWDYQDSAGTDAAAAADDNGRDDSDLPPPASVRRAAAASSPADLRDAGAAAAPSACEPPELLRRFDWPSRRQIGQGQQGVVFRVQVVGSTQRVAIKVIHKFPPSLMDPPPAPGPPPSHWQHRVATAAAERERLAVAAARQRGLVAEIRAELATLSRVSGHPNCLQLLDVLEDDEHIHVITPYYPAGTLDRALKTAPVPGPLPQAKVAALFRSVLKAVAHSHRNRVAHRDIKPANFLLTAELSDPRCALVLCDYGLAALLPDPSTRLRDRVGSPYTIAPEVLARNYGLECDLWSCGVLLHFLLAGYYPFAGTTVEAIFAGVRSAPLNLSGPAWAPICPEAKQLVRGLMCRDVRLRTTAAEALANPWIKAAATGAGAAGARGPGAAVASSGRAAASAAPAPGSAVSGPASSGGLSTPSSVLSRSNSGEATAHGTAAAACGAPRGDIDTIRSDAEGPGADDDGGIDADAADADDAAADDGLVIARLGSRGAAGGPFSAARLHEAMAAAAAVGNEPLPQGSLPLKTPCDDGGSADLPVAGRGGPLGPSPVARSRPPRSVTATWSDVQRMPHGDGGGRGGSGVLQLPPINGRRAPRKSQSTSALEVPPAEGSEPEGDSDTSGPGSHAYGAGPPPHDRHSLGIMRPQAAAGGAPVPRSPRAAPQPGSAAARAAVLAFVGSFRRGLDAPYVDMLQALTDQEVAAAAARFFQGLIALEVILRQQGAPQGPFLEGRRPGLAEFSTVPTACRLMASLAVNRHLDVLAASEQLGCTHLAAWFRAAVADPVFAAEVAPLPARHIANVDAKLYVSHAGPCPLLGPAQVGWAAARLRQADEAGAAAQGDALAFTLIEGATTGRDPRAAAAVAAAAAAGPAGSARHDRIREQLVCSSRGGAADSGLRRASVASWCRPGAPAPAS